MRSEKHYRFQPYCNTVLSHCACDIFPKFWNDKMNFTHRDYKRIEAASGDESRNKLNKSNGGQI